MPLSDLVTPALPVIVAPRLRVPPLFTLINPSAAPKARKPPFKALLLAAASSNPPLVKFNVAPTGMVSVKPPEPLRIKALRVIDETSVLSAPVRATTL